MSGRLVGFLLILLSSAAASAQTCSPLPFSLANGQNANADQVMSNFNHLRDCINSGGGSAAPLQGYIGGLTMSNNVSTPNTVMDTAAGVAVSDDALALMKLATAFTKNASAAWAVGTGNGCLDSGSSLAAATWYHLFVIQRTDTGVVDELCSTSATSPTMPSSYTKKRRIGSFKTVGANQIKAFTQVGDQFFWLTPVNDAQALSVGNTPVTQPLASVPLGVRVNALIRIDFYNPASWAGLTFPTHETTTDVSVPVGNFIMNMPAGITQAGQYDTLTNTSQQIKLLMNAPSGTVNIVTYGWVDSRGRFN